MANLTRDQVLQALRALSETDRTYVLAQLASSVSTAREASPEAAVQTTAGPVETTPDGLSELHKELASYRFAQGRFCPLGWGAKSGLGNLGVQALGAHSEQLE